MTINLLALWTVVPIREEKEIGMEKSTGQEQARSARILRLSDDGFGYLQALDNGEVHAFTFESIFGYGGETVDELGIQSGTIVDFWTDDAGHVFAMNIPAFESGIAL